MANQGKYRFTDEKITTEVLAFTRYLKGERFAAATVEMYGNYVGYFLNWQQGGSTTYQELLRFVGHCKRDGYVTKRINMMLTSLRHYFSYKGVTPNPAEGLRVRGEVKQVIGEVLSSSELEALYRDYEVYDDRSYRNKVMVGFYVYQGLTTDELQRLQVSDIDLRSGVVKVNVSSKSAHHRVGQCRSLSLRVEQVIDLQGYLLEVRPRILRALSSGVRAGQPSRKPDKIDWKVIEHQLFMSMHGSSVMKSSVRFMLDDLRKLNRSVRDAVHLRSSVIANWLREHDIRVVQYMAGHLSISSTERYRSADLSALEQALKRCHPLG